MERKELAGKVALVTGGASGIGLATARLLARAGADIAILDCNAQDARAAAQSMRGEAVVAEAYVVDLADSAAITGILDEVYANFGRIDVLVNCAGVTGRIAGLLDSDDALWDRVFAINIKAPFILTREVGRRMIERGEGGRIVNVTSSSAHRARMSLPAYGSSKAALAQLTRIAAAEFGPHGINVNAVAPGVTETPTGTGQIDPAMLRQAMQEGPISNLLGRISQPVDIAEAILFLCLPASRQITAQTIHVSAGAIV